MPYPLATRAGIQHYGTAREWLAEWGRIINVCTTRGEIARLRAGVEMNEAAIAEVARFDPRTAEAVRVAVWIATLDWDVGEMVA